jgi:hypothetical protein
VTTKITGGKVTGLLALTVEAQAGLEIGDAVHLTGPYEVNLADGTKPVLGTVSAANKKRSGSSFPVANTPGDCTVEARGLFVATSTAGAGGITAGLLFKPDPAAPGKKFIIAAAGDAGVCGIALTTAAANAKFDGLWR